MEAVMGLMRRMPPKTPRWLSLPFSPFCPNTPPISSLKSISPFQRRCRDGFRFGWWIGGVWVGMTGGEFGWLWMMVGLLVAERGERRKDLGIGMVDEGGRNC
ncbi:Hypothetical predicted protein [Prunus dulcis]|uniref:Uncharacterized protein n=1 Tax=Prunus dulcis TaxID=3755 RepID=A0A5E4G3V9_PRUDU|nr:hypothetical protein L3X38_012353 [Prunus dulcis]VVA34360.1 Hypothetical predicted protein [Prunus dulcis]